jgi:hypothetical protein
MPESGRSIARRRPRRRPPTLLSAAVLAAVLAGACGSSTSPPAPSPTPVPWTPPAATPTPLPTASPAVLPLAVVARYDDLRAGVSADDLRSAAAEGGLLVPCEVASMTLEGAALPPGPGAECLPAIEIAPAILASDSADSPLPAGALALLPPGLVAPQVKVLPIGEADLFGAPSHRALPYPLQAVAAPGIPGAAYDVADIRTLVSTGDTCPDRGFSHMAVTKKKGWDWTLAGGTATYNGFRLDTQYSGPHGGGWLVPNIRVGRTGGLLAALISDNDIGANDFECPVVDNWVQHDSGMIFTIDPRTVPLLAGKGGVSVVTLGSNHITNAGLDGVRQTIRYLDAAGIEHAGAGLTLEGALAPAVIDVRGVKFAFVGWDDTHGSRVARANSPGVAPMTDEAVCSSLQAARAVADVVIAMPQWGWPEYHNDITSEQIAQRARMYECGADHILGSGTHWASWASILPGPNGPQFAIGSHGNFFFDQNWSQETMEGVIVEATFSGTQLVQFRLHPYVVAYGAQPNLLDPSHDGSDVMNRVWSVSEVR